MRKQYQAIGVDFRVIDHTLGQSGFGKRPFCPVVSVLSTERLLFVRADFSGLWRFQVREVRHLEERVPHLARLHPPLHGLQLGGRIAVLSQQGQSKQINLSR